MLVIDHHTHYMCVRFLKSKEDTCTQLENIMLELRHLHARHHSQSGAFAHVIKLDSDTVFEAAPTRPRCARMGVGVHFFATYPHHRRPPPAHRRRPRRGVRSHARRHPLTSLWWALETP
jgi:hypothetical protein